MKRYLFYALLLALLAATPADMMAQRRAKTSKNRKAKTERTTQSTKSKTVSGNQSFTVNGVSFTMVSVQGGAFTMGATSEQGSDASDDEKPAHKVTVSSFSIGQTEVTQELWQAVMGTNPSEFKGAKRPVEKVSWDDCQEFIRKLNAKTGKNFRLPTEAEWEYAARGGSKSQGYKYSGSNSLSDVAWYDKNSYDKGKNSPDYGTHTVATKSPNELGIYDMSGNVWEWCQDRWYNYDGSATEYSSSRVVRGGSWYSFAGACRLAHRGGSLPDGRGCDLGLRLAL